MKSRWIMAAVACGLLLVLSSVAMSGDGCGRECGPKAPPGARAGHPTVALEEAGVTEEQVKLLGDLRSDQRLKAVDLKASLEKATIKLQRVLAQDDPKEEALHGAIEEVGRAQIALRKHAATGFVKAREILGPEVWKKARGLLTRHVFGPGHGHGPHAGCHGRCGGTECHGGRCGGHAGPGARCGCGCEGCEHHRQGCGGSEADHGARSGCGCEGCDHHRQGCGSGQGRPEPKDDD